MSESQYQELFQKYLNGNISNEIFVRSFEKQWVEDRDNKVKYDCRFQRIIDRIFSSCDCYSENPEGPFEINEKQLKEEVDLLNHIWFG